MMGRPRLGRPRLSSSMTVTQFDHGYWYATELKQFATDLGIPSVARLRKDQLERAIRQLLRFGTIGSLVSQYRRPRPNETPTSGCVWIVASFGTRTMQSRKIFWSNRRRNSRPAIGAGPAHATD